MKIHIAGLHLLDDATLDKMKAAAASAGHEVAAFGANELDAAKLTEIGTAVTSAINAAEQPGVSGEQKMLNAVAAVSPVIVDYVAKGGLSTVITDVEQFARHLIESTLADLRQTGAAKVAAAVLKVVG